MKQQLFGISAGLGILMASTLIVPGQAISFSDGFEGASLNPFWTASTVSGASITLPSTGQAHTGAQSVQFDAPATGYSSLSHTFATPVYGQMSVWLYQAQVTEMDVLIGINTPGANEADVYSNGGGNYAGFFFYDSMNAHFTGSIIQRPAGWHQLSISALDTGLTLSADGNVFYSGPPMPFTTLLFQTSHEEGSGSFNSPVYWDDFSGSFSPVPEPSTWALMVLAGAAVTRLKLRRKRG